MKVINFFAGPGSGKSTTAAGLFEKMKLEGYNVELVTEYAKDMVWEQRHNILGDQLYILAKQNRRLLRLKEVVEWVITDSPLLQSLVYTDPDKVSSSYFRLVEELWDSYINVNFFINRSPAKKFNPVGRTQKDVEEASVKDREILDLLKIRNVPYEVIIGDRTASGQAFEYLFPIKEPRHDF
jgi:hypothetical protein